MSSLTLRPTAPCRRQHDLLLDPSSGNGAPSRWQKTGGKKHIETRLLLSNPLTCCTNVSQLRPLPVSRTHLQLAVTCKSGDVRLLVLSKKGGGGGGGGNMRNRACALSEYNKASVLCCAVRVFKRPAQHNRACNRFSVPWLPSFCCSPLSGRCGKTSGLRLCAGSPCQLTVVTTMGVRFGRRGCR